MRRNPVRSTVRAVLIVLAGILLACGFGISGSSDGLVRDEIVRDEIVRDEIVPAIHAIRDETPEDSTTHWSASGQWIAFEPDAGDQDLSRGPWGIAPSAVPSTTIYLPIVLQDQAAGPPPTWWQPPVNTTWQWQLTDPIDPSFDVEMYDIDMFDNGAGTVAALHAEGRKVICYVSVGSWEQWRPDADQFPESVLGSNYEGWPGEKWLDIRQIDLLAPIMRSRLDRCQAKGFDGIEPDNMDGYTNNTGFPLTYQDQLNYNIWLANEAHARGLSIGLKNDDEQVGDLVSRFDWAMTEDCFADGWCAEVQPFIAAGKAVFAAEYTDQMTVNEFLSGVCPQAQAMGLSAILKDRDLDAWRRGCP